MSTAQKKALASYRRRLKARGLVRLEIQAPARDAPLLRRVAKLLREDPEEAAAMRQRLHEVTGTRPALSRKALLAAAPLEGIDLTRHPDRGREVDL